MRHSCTRERGSCGTIRYADVSCTMLLKLKRTPGLYLVGFMGSGKSAVGRLLADELGWSLRRHRRRYREGARRFDRRNFRPARRAGIPGRWSVRRSASACARSNAAGRWCWRWAAARSSIRRIESCSKSAASPSGWIVPSRASARAWTAQIAPAAGARSRKIPPALRRPPGRLPQGRVSDRSRHRRSRRDRGGDFEAPDFLASMPVSARPRAADLSRRASEPPTRIRPCCAMCAVEGEALIAGTQRYDLRSFRQYLRHRRGKGQRPNGVARSNGCSARALPAG